jgi:glycosyltransferase involved in cell wall biosynthesis
LEEIDWIGNLPHHEAMERMKCADVFVHTSLQEGTPHVVMEALSMGMPVICHDACGMGVAVTAECGIKVPLVDFETSVCSFRSALDRLEQNPGLLRELSQGALKRASELSWDALAERIARTLDRLAEARQPSRRASAAGAVAP